MQKIKWGIVFIGVMSLASAANAATCAINTWCFGSNPQSVSDGTNYSTVSGSAVTGTVTVYSEQVNSSNNNFYSFSDSTINALFSTNDSVYDEGIGVAPYDPAEGSSNNFSNQGGIADGISCGYRTTCDNVLLVELGSNIAQGTTLKFLLQAGNGDGNVQTYSANFYTQDGGNVTTSGMNLGSIVGTAAAGTISTNGTNAQVTLKKDTSGVEWVAIEADCHYMLLDTIQGAAPSGVPEPRFYGLLLASLLGIAGVVYQRRRTAQTNA